MLAQALKWPLSPLWYLKRSLEQPSVAQRKLLRMAIRRAKDTAWGRAHGFGELYRSPSLIEEYQRRVPLSNYKDLQPYLDRVVNGEKDVLWPGHPLAFAVSGGTRSGGRLVPISQETMAFLTRSSLLPGLCYLASRHGASEILRGKILSLPGGIEKSMVGSAKMTGEVSGLLAHRIPRILGNWFQALPRHVMLMEDWNAKLFESARIAVLKDVRSLIMVPSWAPIFFEYVREVVGAATGAEALRQVWPKLQVFFSGGVALSAYRSILESYLGPRVEFIESYSASEGLFAFQDCAEKEGLIVNLNSGVFFEFIPAGREKLGSETRYTIDNAEPGVDYVLHVTNTSGLWSLCVEDIVQLVSTQPPRLRIMGRVGEMLDRFGDATSSEHVHKVLTAADEVSGARCINHHLTYFNTPESSTPRHHWVLEFDIEPPDIKSYARLLDEFMRQFNGRYRTRREPNAMAGPIVTVVTRGSCIAYLRSTRKRFSGQSKIVNVSEDSKISEDIISVAREINGSCVTTIRID